MASLGGFYGGLAKRAVTKRAAGTVRRGVRAYVPQMEEMSEMLNPPAHPMVTEADERAREKGYRQYFGSDFSRLFRKARKP